MTEFFFFSLIFKPRLHVQFLLAMAMQFQLITAFLSHVQFSV